MGRTEATIVGLTGLRPPRGSLGIAGSVAVHLAFLLALLMVVPKSHPPPPKEKTVSVEILDVSQFQQIFAPPTPDLPEPVLAVPSTPPEIPLPQEASLPTDLPTVTVKPDGMMVPKAFLAAAALADPRSAEALAALPQLNPGDRIVQLCSVEAMAQIAALDEKYQPDLVAAYSMKNIRYDGSTIDAPGAAFRSKGRWYELAFKCGLTGSFEDVASFEFRIGDEIPHEQWASHDLADGGDLDQN